MSSKCLSRAIPISNLRNLDHYASHIFLSPTTFNLETGKRSPPSSNSSNTFLLISGNKKETTIHGPLRYSPSPPSFSYQAHDDDDEPAAAREAVRLYLHQELGLSMDESLQIAFNSPNYVALLIDSVHDLDQLSSSSSSALPSLWSRSRDNHSIPSPSASPSLLSFTDKVYEMAKRKGDKGLLPYLESIGLTLPSASHLARYLSSHTLPSLIQQVKYVKEIFFSDSNSGGLIGKNARCMMMYLSISVDEDLQQTLSFFEKIQARRGGLDSLGFRDVSFRHLIESFPQLLLLPIETCAKPMLGFLEDVGVPQGCVWKILLLFPPIMFFDMERDVKPRLQLFEKFGTDYNDFGMILLKYPWILSTSILQNCEKVFHFFDEEKVPKDRVVVAMKNWPCLLGCSVNKLKLMVEQFGEFDVRDKKFGRVIARSPQLLLQKPHDFLQVVFFFKGLGLDEESVGRILARCPEVFAASIDETLNRKLGFLLSIGVSRNHHPRVIKKYPEFFVCDVDRALLPRMRYFMKIGLSKKDVSFMVRRFSPLLGYSIKEVLKPKIEFLLDIMKKPLSDVVEYPRYFSYSLEKKIKPRYQLLKGRNLECSLKEMLGKNDEEFAAEFMDVGRMLVPPE